MNRELSVAVTHENLQVDVTATTIPLENPDPVNYCIKGRYGVPMSRKVCGIVKGEAADVAHDTTERGPPPQASSNYKRRLSNQDAGVLALPGTNKRRPFPGSPASALTDRSATIGCYREVDGLIST